MDNGMHNDTHTDKGKGLLVNGVEEESVSVKPEHSPKNKGVDNGSAIVGDYSSLASNLQALRDTTMEEPPDELQHISDTVIPLSLLLSRLAQFSHTKLQELILNLASKPLPHPTANGSINGIVNSGANGSAKSAAGVPSPALEDTSSESLEKKTMILNFVQDLHARWVKALVIAEWARNADEVGKLIDLRAHLVDQLGLYHKAFWDMVQVKRDLVYAKVPSPDLKTALEVLSTGAVHWMPDFGYLPKPRLTAQEKLYWLNEIEVTLNMRLQLHEYEQIPQPWKQYKIANGRVTFTVPGEFEVDLTLSSEEFKTQLWFLDFRLIFSPTPPEVTGNAREFIEAQVNTILQTDGLPGCYNYLHGLTLTTKIGEFARQAVELDHSGLWIDTLKVERLNRALSIQYWVQRSHSQGSPSWILIGVHSGKASEGEYDPGTPSHLMLQWFRDGKEVKDVDIPFDVDNISTEKLLTTIISLHIEHLLSSIYNALKSKPRYANKNGRLVLQISDQPRANSSLAMQLLGEDNAVLGIGTWMGNFYFVDRSPDGLEWAQRFNSLRNPVHEGAGVLEQFRWSYTARCLRMLPRPPEWVVIPHSQAPVALDETKRVVYSHAPPSRDAFHAVWIRNTRWEPQWFAMMSLSLGGDRWWLVEVAAEGRGLPGSYIRTFTELPITPSDLLLPSSPLIPKLTEHATDIMAHIRDLRGLHQQETAHAGRNPGDDGSWRIWARSIDMLPPRSASDDAARTPWAAKFIPIICKGAAPTPASEDLDLNADASTLQRRLPPWRGNIEVKVAVTNRAKFDLLQPKLDRDVSYDHRLGQFTLRFRPKMSDNLSPIIQARMQALDRLVEIVDALRRGGKHVAPKRITLRKIIFTYGDSISAIPLPNQVPAPDQKEQRPWKVRLNLAKEEGVDVVLENGNPHLRVIDYLRAAANSPTFTKLPAWLVFTLPLFRALERVQDAWDTVFAKDQGACYIFHKSLDWVTLRFALAGAKSRRMHLDIQPRDKGGKLMWHIYRPATDANVNNENDEFNKILKQRVWSTSGVGFKGLMNSAAANWDDGIENLLTLINDSLLSLAGTPPPPQQKQPQQLPHHLQAPPAAQSQDLQQPIPAPGPQARFPHQLQQPQQPYQQQPRLPQQHMAQANMRGQGQHQAQAQGQQRASLGKNNNAPVVILD